MFLETDRNLPSSAYSDDQTLTMPLPCLRLLTPRGCGQALVKTSPLRAASRRHPGVPSVHTHTRLRDGGPGTPKFSAIGLGLG